MSKRTDVAKRRAELIRMKYKGMPLEIIADLLAEKYEVLSSTIRYDWEHRHNWIMAFLDIELEDKNQIISDLFMEYRQLHLHCMNLLEMTDNDNVKCGVLKLLNSNLKDKIKLLMDSGILDKVVNEEIQIVFTTEKDDE